MCLALYRPEGTTISKDILEASFEQNNDGWGLMHHDRETQTVQVVKGLDFKGYMETIASMENREYALHTRWATHGKVAVMNCHPFRVTKNIWVMHNGILDADTRSNPDMSDTWHFVKRDLRPVLANNPDLISNPKYLKWLEQDITSYNKLIFMRSDGYVGIVNETSGIWHADVWMSNSGCIWRQKQWSGHTNREWTAADQIAWDKRHNEPTLVKDFDSHVRYINRIKKDPRFFGLGVFDAETLDGMYDLKAKHFVMEVADQDLMIDLQTQVNENLKEAGITSEELQRMYAQVDAVDEEIEVAFEPEIPVVDVMTDKEAAELQARISDAEFCGLFEDELGDEESAYWNRLYQRHETVGTCG